MGPLNDNEKKALVRIILKDNDKNEDLEMGFAAKLKETKDDSAPVLLTCSGVFPQDTKQHEEDNFFVDEYLPKSKSSLFPKSKKKNQLKKVTLIKHNETMDISSALYEGGNSDRSFLCYTSLSEEKKKQIKKLSAYVFEDQEIIELQFVNQGGTYMLTNKSKQGFDEARAKGAPVIYQSDQGGNKVVGVLGSNDNSKGNPILSPIFLQGGMFKVPDARPSASVCDNATGPGPSRNQDTDESAARSSGADTGDSQSNKQQSDDRRAPGNSGDVVQVGPYSQTNNENSADTDGGLQQITNCFNVTISGKVKVVAIGERNTVEMNMREDCSPFDIGLYFKEIGSSSPQDKLGFIENVWKPGEIFDFPLSIENRKPRKFVFEWLRRYPWLAYSKYLDGAFCFPCVLFGVESGRNAHKLDKLLKSPLTCWTSAASRLTKHASGKCEMHNFAVIAMDNFLKTMRQQAVPVDQQLNNIIQQQIDRNRTVLKSLFETIIFCGRNNIALRGQRDDDPTNASLSGNFQALLEFRVQSGDQILQNHLETAPRNATYISKTIQNQMIETVGSYILTSLSKEIRDSKFFSVMADEAADIPNKENLFLVIRFIDSRNIIREEFIGFSLCDEGTTGAAIKDKILTAVAELGLSMDDCRGQCYDGAGNMAGCLNGVSTLIRNEFDKAIYVHCMNHRLNLCVADTCQQPLVRNMMDTVKRISDFFNNSPKRQQYLVMKVKEIMPQANHTVLINVCRTRWIERIEGMDRVVELLRPVVATLEDISMNNNDLGTGDWNRPSRNDAQTLLNAITFSFIVAIVIVRHMLDLTRPLTVKLQKKAMDLLKAKDELALLKSVLTEMRTDIDARHNALYQEAVTLAGQVSVQPTMPRVAQRQVHRANAAARNPEEYYRTNLTVVFLDHIVQQLNNRFQDDMFVCYRALSVIPSIMLATGIVWKDNVLAFCEHYRQDIPNYAGLQAELILWERMWMRKDDLGEEIPDSLEGTLEHIDNVAYANIHTILQILITIPMSSASCERSISTLRNLKNYLRNTMAQDRMNGLALMHSHRDMDLDLEEIIDLFATLNPTRMRMENILQ